MPGRFWSFWYGIEQVEGFELRALARNRGKKIWIDMWPLDRLLVDSG